jgi:hypothetical protein
MFRAFSLPSSGAQWLQWQPLVLPLYRGDSRAAVRGRANRPDHEQQHDYSRDTKVKPEAATAVIELLMMGGKTPETCWAVNKRQYNKLENCCTWLVIYLNCTMMDGLTNLKFGLVINFRQPDAGGQIQNYWTHYLDTIQSIKLEFTFAFYL